ncbi:hypothetical protein EUX98_g1853 [Antrodiella citrinella]|uniref:biotin synthase n=1 Tax=Antrodiella citrinella TaxID=2447956 RepID=A0A4S4N3H1_9APHY|nr:hypothetical protein EUX98_g1853 [Antrodiella citrinella]
MFRTGASSLRIAGRFTRSLATHTNTSTTGVTSATTRHDWTKKEIRAIYDAPLLDLVFRSAAVHRQHHDPTKIQLCTLMNIKTGGCSEDCSYCSQSSRYSTPTKASKLVDIEPVLQAARKAKENGSTRFCMGAAWRDLAGRKRGFEKILTMVREVITTRSYDERLDTISAVRDAGISVCSGGILGLGESDEDRVSLIWEVSSMPEHPESFPVNALVPIEGTPLAGNEPVQYHTLLRTIATARIVLPTSIIRLAAGRQELDEAKQAMCFMAGANAVFTGDAMLTTPCMTLSFFLDC